MKVKQGFYWHVHHDMLLEYCYDYEERVNYIKNYKLQGEIETRLRLFKPVKGKLPKDLIKIGQKLGEAERKLDEAVRKLDEILEKHKPFLEKLHKKECGCKEWNGKRIVFEEK